MNPNDPIRSSDLSTDRLFQLVETKLHLLTEMQQMSIEQTDLVSQHDMTSLMTLLSRKQSLMDALRDVQSQLIPFQSQDPESRSWPSPERRKACQAIVANCDALVQNLIVMENHSLDNMTIQRDMVAAQLQQNVNASTLQQAYHSSDVDEEAWADGSLSIEG